MIPNLRVKGTPFDTVVAVFAAGRPFPRLAAALLVASRALARCRRRWGGCLHHGRQDRVQVEGVAATAHLDTALFGVMRCKAGDGVKEEGEWVRGIQILYMCTVAHVSPRLHR